MSLDRHTAEAAQSMSNTLNAILTGAADMAANKVASLPRSGGSSERSAADSSPFPGLNLDILGKVKECGKSLLCGAPLQQSNSLPSLTQSPQMAVASATLPMPTGVAHIADGTIVAPGAGGMKASFGLAGVGI